MAGLNRGSIYKLERESIRRFVASHTFIGRTLDYGCGSQPYRDLVERSAQYEPYDRAENPGGTGGDVGDEPEGRYDTILCTQVIQYVPDPYVLLRWFRDELLAAGGALVLTGPGCWHEEEPTSLHRFTIANISRLLRNAAYEVERLEDRANIDLGGFGISLGWGAVARA